MASARRRGNRWTALYRDQNGAQKSAGTYDTEDLALQNARAHEAVEASGRDAKMVLGNPQVVYQTAKRGRMTVAGYAPGWLAGHRLEETSRESYGHMLKHIVSGLGSVTLTELGAQKAREFIRSLEGRMSGATAGHVLTVLRELCKTAVIDGLMERDPTQGIKIAGRRCREMRILTPAEYRRVEAAIDPHYQLLLRTLISTGLRWGEAIALRPGDIIQEEGCWAVKVRRTIAEVQGRQTERNYGKTAAAIRVVTVDDELGRDLSLCGPGLIFRSRRGTRIQRSNFRRVWLRALEQAGVEGVRVHDLRHSHASWLANNGADLVTVRDRLGHTDLKTTSRYLHVIKGGRDPGLDALGRALAS